MWLNFLNEFNCYRVIIWMRTVAMSMRLFFSGFHLSRVARLSAVFTTLLFILLFFLWPVLGLRNLVSALLTWTSGVPLPIGGTIFILVHIVTVIIVMPGTPLNLASGFLFGVTIGSLLSITGCFLGGAVSYYLAKTLLRQWAERTVATMPRFRAIDKAVTDQSLLMILLLRLSPLTPYGICCYLLGLSKVSVRDYMLATFVGIIPGTVMYTFMGTMMADLNDIWLKNNKPESTSIAVVTITLFIVSTVALLVAITWLTKRALNRALDRTPDADKIHNI